MSPAADISTIHRAILESMGEGVIFINAEDRLAFINHTAEQIRGIRAENFIGRHILTIHSPASAERVEKLLCGLKDGSIQQTRRVIEVKGKYFENSYYPIRATDSTYLGAVLVSRDITEKQLLKEENRLLRDQMGLGDAFNDFVGTSQPILQLFQTIAAIATLDSTILITGESGTGKELVAAAVRQHSKRLNKPMVKVNCAALPENLVESELFGHERGAFSGAFSSHRGKFELAHGGTIFLDEIGDLPPSAQAKLLRVLQDRTITRVGGEKESAVDVRIIAATNQDLQALVAVGRFREDLYFRLNVITIHVPPFGSGARTSCCWPNIFCGALRTRWGARSPGSARLRPISWRPTISPAMSGSWSTPSSGASPSAAAGTSCPRISPPVSSRPGAEPPRPGAKTTPAPCAPCPARLTISSTR
ncbi:sigma-54-dependent Fis family transcriptional regulator [Geobacter sp. FeAm09]|uniref:sigma-54 interaction domain-containing protein n=1 Tax=Geobacter sp. FeAm09 TaxID=2597769 RepID=UPI00272C0AE3|nr:sigma 54-interacting transcriptional regulator [Geobacter sp. FeAm09]